MQFEQRVQANAKFGFTERQARVLVGMPSGVCLLEDELVTLEAQKPELLIVLAEPPLMAKHLRMAEAYRAKATALAAGLEHDGERDAARMALR